MLAKLFNLLYYLFLTAVGIIAVLLLISIFPITGNYRVMVVLSGSMEPAIGTGSIVVVKPNKSVEGGPPVYEVGDVVTFGKISKADTPVTHRIVEVKQMNGQNVYTTKGDANNAPDPKEITASEIAGKELFTIPYIGYAISAAKKPWGFAALIIIPALIIIFDEVKKIRNEMMKIRNKKKDQNPQHENQIQKIE